MKLLLTLGLNFVILLLFSHSLSAQKSIIRGQVTDENKVPLVSVTIAVAGKNTTAITTTNGEFSIEAETKDKLKFSFVGMENKTVDVNSRLFLNVVLKLKIENSDEVVVIGYETVRRSDVTGSISTITGSDLRKQAI
ncbi:MAG: carboxypeptidase-like regulatory domain-containing protein, partial [Chitinophagaceae bacterium]|nr:carboxypeptidase-like regulatory domain-containing protein [Chitinophagaceae bacterium]